MKTNISRFYVNSSDEDNAYEYKVHGVTFMLKYAGKANRKFVSSTVKHTLAQKSKIESGESTKEEALASTADDVDLNVLLDSILVGWKGLVDDDTGKDIPFSKEFARTMLSDLPDLVSDLISSSSNKDNFLDVNEKKYLK